MGFAKNEICPFPRFHYLNFATGLIFGKGRMKRMVITPLFIQISF